MSPTALFTPGYRQVSASACSSVGREVYPGWWDEGGPGGVLPGYYPDPSQYPYLVIFQPQGPTYGQTKGKSELFMRFPKIGSQIDPN